jgi:Phospholipase_D-nuclease N-terminal
MLAYSYPILGVFWSMLIFFGFFVVIWVVIWCFVDDFRRSDHSGLAKAGWAVLIIFLPLIGSLIYIIARPAQV